MKAKQRAQILVDLPNEVLDRLYSQAESEERPINEIVADAVQFYLHGKLYGPQRPGPKVHAA